MTQNSSVKDHDHKKIAAQLFNRVWDYLDQEQRTEEDNMSMIHMAHASRYHWGEVGEPINLVRGEWQVSRVYSVVERAEPALFHAESCLALCLEHHIKDFDLAFAYEAMARAYKIKQDLEQMEKYIQFAYEACDKVAKDADRNVVLGELRTI
ncbi:hypothetical protein [Pontibacillus sp. HMF3514]|uniref:hypothetical protein n=1 Tax=Pontibacillus sp. HMF3514 TaxID=2692425 RepID=UPI00131F646C|nr:hypothetical protein [Pontibacillus sp. HMF3514]QHE51185.1 hypothetical protein GS400_03695 [Pontibacillus sp. HMF3514]